MILLSSTISETHVFSINLFSDTDDSRVSCNMAKSSLEVVQQELKAFRSQLFKIDLDDDNSKQDLKEILDKYLQNNFEPFAEEYLIARFDVEIVR